MELIERAGWGPFVSLSKSVRSCKRLDTRQDGDVLALGGVGNVKSVRWWQPRSVLGVRVLPGGGSGRGVWLAGTGLCRWCACRTAKECPRGGRERVPVGVDRGERQPDLACGDPDPGGDLEQVHA